MNTTPHITEQIATYLADGLDAQERAEFESHVKDCGACAAELDRARRMEARMSELFESARPGADFEDRMLGRLRLSAGFHRGRAMAIIKKAAIAAAAVIVVGGMGIVGQDYLEHGRLTMLQSHDTIAATLQAIGTPIPVSPPTRPLEALRAGHRQSNMVANGPIGREDVGLQFAGEEDRDALDRSRVSQVAQAPKQILDDEKSKEPSLKQNIDSYFKAGNYVQAAAPGFVVNDVTGQTSTLKIGLPELRNDRSQDSGGGFGGGGRGGTTGSDLRQTRIGSSSSGLSLDGQGRSITVAGSNGFGLVGGLPSVNQEISNSAGLIKNGAGSIAMGYISGGTQTTLEERKEADKNANFALAMVDGPAQSQTTPSSQPGTATATVGDRKVIREGTMEFEVDSFDSAFATIRQVISEEGGFVAAADSDKLPNGKVRGSVTVRVPPDHLDTLVLKLRALGELKTQRLGSRDVGKEYTDLEGQLRAARAMEERLLEMIKTANGKVADLLQAERELGTWRTKIETITGQLNYYNNLVSLATLTINAYEKDIRTAASATQSEEISAGVETDDVESARNAAIKSIDEAKGRIIESTLQKLEAGQFAARIIAELPPENAGQIVDRLKQLGRIARLDSQRHQTETPGTSSVTVQPKVEIAPTRIIVSMYNLANVAPRLTTNLNLAATDVEASYRAILKRVNDAGGRIITSNLNRQDATQATGNIQFELKRNQADLVRNDLTKDVQVLRLTVNDNPDTANVTTAKQAFVVQIIPASQVPPRETRTISVEAQDVESAMQSINAAAASAGGRTIESNLSQETGGASVARLMIEVPLDKLDQLVTAAKQQGKLRAAESSKNSQVPEGALARAQVNLTIGSADSIVPQKGGLWDSLRDGLSTSVKGLLWSLQLMVIGLCLVAPWGLMVWGGWKLFRKGQRAEGRGQTVG